MLDPARPLENKMPESSPTHVRSNERVEVVTLEWPVEHDGKVYDKVTVSRMNVAQLAAYIENIASDRGLAALPMFDVPRAVIEALDADDGDKLDEVAASFLPRSFHRAASTPATGANTSGSAQQVSGDKTLPG